MKQILLNIFTKPQYKWTLIDDFKFLGLCLVVGLIGLFIYWLITK